MRTWISPGTIGIVINPTASASKHVHQLTEMTKDGKQTMDAHGIACKSKFFTTTMTLGTNDWPTRSAMLRSTPNSLG
jgi:hypothetical protein